ncbi:PepSY domain-containing protein [Nannocystis punicea]|uniref:PepSY domain-containing protein n=1 Tax=Nannocystis punicea TaxID=2995304 RepID=A0ABY7H2F9_9BACT|nr:PepSY domain-containing protein [Nannocystis poenicansa]WAS93448.1 PepSY domain-containing protein [Nannocystis poenicansa]
MHALLMSLLLSLAPSCGHAATSATPAGGSAPTAAATPPREAAAKPKISLEAAQATALKQVPGTVIDSELEREHGRWIYSIEIQPTDRAQPRKEVEVDGDTGSVILVEAEDYDD